MAAIQMVDVHLPTTDGRTVLLSRYTEPESDQALLLRQLKMRLPAQPPPRITSGDVPGALTGLLVVPTLADAPPQNQSLEPILGRQLRNPG
jgi:hypothetical protein